ncbi:MAG: VCBS repeat-containing protein, partial [Planctomycetaceae bacterium]|nr:VCBS repeat-containing protein [Planctomycetaceae bacterium]
MALPCLLALALAPSQSFATRLIPLEGQVKRAAFVDLDRDGAVDVLAEKTNALSWLAGDGAGGFAAPRLVAGGSGWTPLFFRDLDGDGALDALGVRALASELVFARGSGAGFAAPTVVALGSFRTADAGDLD